MGDFWSASFVFSSNLGGQDIFFPPKRSAGYFFLSISLQDFCFLKKVSCLHLQNVFTFTLWLLQ